MGGGERGGDGRGVGDGESEGFREGEDDYGHLSTHLHDDFLAHSLDYLAAHMRGHSLATLFVPAEAQSRNAIPP